MQEDELVGVQWMPLEDYFAIPFTATRRVAACHACVAAARAGACAARRHPPLAAAQAGAPARVVVSPLHAAQPCRPLFQKIHAACRAYADGTYRRVQGRM